MLRCGGAVREGVRVEALGALVCVRLVPREGAVVCLDVFTRYEVSVRSRDDVVGGVERSSTTLRGVLRIDEEVVPASPRTTTRFREELFRSVEATGLPPDALAGCRREVIRVDSPLPWGEAERRSARVIIDEVRRGASLSSRALRVRAARAVSVIEVLMPRPPVFDTAVKLALPKVPSKVAIRAEAGVGR
jgi:hypothetical protein